MKRLIIGIILLQLFSANIKCHIIQGHALENNKNRIFLYGDAHNAENKNIKQNNYLNKNILPQIDFKIISERPFVSEYLFFIDGLLATTYSDQTPLTFLKVKDYSPFCNKILSIDNRAFINTVFKIQNILKSTKEKLSKNTVENIQRLFQSIFSEIDQILQNLENEYNERLNSFDLTTEQQTFLMENLKATKKTIESSIKKWLEILKENNPEYFEKINNEIIPQTIGILDTKLILEILEQIKINDKIAVFAGFNHINNLVKIFDSIGFNEKEKITANIEEGLDPKYFDWMLLPSTPR